MAKLSVNGTDEMRICQMAAEYTMVRHPVNVDTPLFYTLNHILEKMVE
jgi:hypothetical protein